MKFVLKCSLYIIAVTIYLKIQYWCYEIFQHSPQTKVEQAFSLLQVKGSAMCLKSTIVSSYWHNHWVDRVVHTCNLLEMKAERSSNTSRYELKMTTQIFWCCFLFNWRWDSNHKRRRLQWRCSSNDIVWEILSIYVTREILLSYFIIGRLLGYT